MTPPAEPPVPKVAGGSAGTAPGSVILHASCVAHEGKAVLILGPSGAGKSALALQLMALGLQLVADDRTCIAARDGALVASSPEAIAGLIEARGVGVLAAEPVARAIVSVVVDLGVPESARLPPRHSMRLLDVTLPLLHKVESDHFPAAIKQYLRGGRSA